MKYSIRTKFTVIFIGLITLLLIGIWCVNTWLLESFYINDKVNVLKSAYNQLDGIVMELNAQNKNISEELIGAEINNSSSNENSDQSLYGVLQKLNEKYNITVALIDSIDNTVVTLSRNRNFLVDKAQRYILGQKLPKHDIVKEYDDYTIQRSIDFKNKDQYLECWGYFSDNSTIFLMSIPLASIKDSVEISNRFLAYVGMIAMVLSIVVIYFTTKRITRPIMKLAHISERMSNLDFEIKYDGNDENEIGILGNSMNSLSDKLKETISDLQKANLELQKDIEQKVQIDEMRKEFIANVSHELKTPIALIMGYAEGLTEGMCEDKESRDYYCEVIADEADKMNKMVRQLLTLTALEFGNDMLNLETFDLTELIKGVISSAGILIEQKEAKLHFDEKDSIIVYADEFKIEEVVTNYLSNALNHVQGSKDIYIKIDDEKEKVKISVMNTGDPIPEEDIENIWTKFYKVDKARTRAYGGSGIGLSIVKAIMEMHHTDYGVKNVENGVVFWFVLNKAK